MRLVYLVITVFVLQIIFSFYYSNEIINQNNYLRQNEIRYQQLKAKYSADQKKLLELTSIQNLSTRIDQTLKPITKTIDLTK